MSLNYVMVGSNDLARSRVFYDAVMAAIGGVIDADYPGYAFSYRLSDGGRIWIAPPYDKGSATPGNGLMLGFAVASEGEVQTAHAIALAHGGSNEGDPGPRPQYGPDFYAGYVRDPDQNKMSFIVNPV